MNKGYLVAHLRVHDKEGFEKFRQLPKDDKGNIKYRINSSTGKKEPIMATSPKQMQSLKDMARKNIIENVIPKIQNELKEQIKEVKSKEDKEEKETIQSEIDKKKREIEELTRTYSIKDGELK